MSRRVSPWLLAFALSAVLWSAIAITILTILRETT